MIVHVHADSSITLDDPDTFTAFSVLAPDHDLTQVVEAFGSDARAGEEGYVWLAISRLHRLGTIHGSVGWREGCDGMIAFAESKGWVDQKRQFVRAHIEGG